MLLLSTPAAVVAMDEAAKFGMTVKGEGLEKIAAADLGRL